MIKIDKIVTIMQREDIYIFECSSETTELFWIFSEPVLKCFSNCNDEELGLKTYEILSYSKKGVPHPEKWSDISTEPLLRAAKVKSFNQFFEGSVCISLQVREDKVILFPTINGGRKRGFMGDANLPTVEISGDEFFANADFAGKKIRECFLLCK